MLRLLRAWDRTLRLRPLQRIEPTRRVPEWLADYHESCWHEVWAALQLAEKFGESMHQIAVATPQAIAAKRRRHRREEPPG